MAIENYVSNDFLSTFVDSINVFDCRISGVDKDTGNSTRSFLIQLSVSAA